MMYVDADLAGVLSRALSEPEAASLATVLVERKLKSLESLKGLSEAELADLRVKSGLTIGKMGRVKRELTETPSAAAPGAPPPYAHPPATATPRLTPAPANGPTALPIVPRVPNDGQATPGGIDPARPWATPKPPPAPAPPLAAPQVGQIIRKVPVDQLDPRKDPRIVVDDAWKAQVEALLSVARSEMNALREENRGLKSEIQKQKVATGPAPLQLHRCSRTAAAAPLQLHRCSCITAAAPL